MILFIVVENGSFLQNLFDA